MGEIDRDKPAREPETRVVSFWVVVTVVTVFTIVFEVGGWLMDALAWAVAIVWFLILCVALVASIRWLFTYRET